MATLDAQTILPGGSIARDDRFYVSDQSEAEGTQDRNATRNDLSLAIPKYEITQATHGLAVGECTYFNGTSWVQADASTADKAAYQGVVVEVVDTGTFIMQQVGYMTGLSGLTAGTLYFLQDDGSLNTTAGTVSRQVLRAESASTAWLIP